eukprot:CAMPEP_0197690638 /NCGR_PEP_ID=MMETSP1338-20131121/108608_1 /TAXON_ID=43686 ORGANISM="Pelagodinium beii, Strain RCC1491" /NCGR_SAMPLE_ID=MMETSP1338 /ASSEMBLY_ACC=CAM_ASM_000754 /LENGTH=45 /DNA_ID= /DNA_START= /DNA_END= /DNA_ORIENTATION=
MSLTACGIGDGDHISAVRVKAKSGTYTLQTSYLIEPDQDWGAGDS